MSYQALDWAHEHSHEYVDLRREPVLYAILMRIARRMHQDPAKGSWPGQGELAKAAQLQDRQAVKAAVDELARRGAIVVTPNGAPKEPGKRGPRAHLYLFPALLNAGDAPAEDPRYSSTDPAVNTGDAPAEDPRYSGPEYRGSEARIPGIRGPNTGDAHAQDPAGRVLEGVLEGEDARASAPVPIPHDPNTCERNLAGLRCSLCGAVKAAAKAAKAAKADRTGDDVAALTAELIQHVRDLNHTRALSHRPAYVVPSLSEAEATARLLIGHPWRQDGCDRFTRLRTGSAGGKELCRCAPRVGGLELRKLGEFADWVGVEETS